MKFFCLFSSLFIIFLSSAADPLPYVVWSFSDFVGSPIYQAVPLRPGVKYYITGSVEHFDGGELPIFALFYSSLPDIPNGASNSIFEISGEPFDVISSSMEFIAPSGPTFYCWLSGTGNYTISITSDVDHSTNPPDDGGDDGGDDSGGGSGGDNSGGGSGGDDSGGGSGGDDSGQGIVVPSAPDLSNPELPLGDFRGIIRSNSEITVEIPGRTEYPEIKFPVPIPGHSNFKVNFFGTMDNPTVFHAYETFRMGFKAFCIVVISFVFFRNTFKLFRKNS